MKIKIVVVIDDPEIVEEYKDIDTDLILSDFESNPRDWFPGSDMRVEFIQ